MSLSNMVIMNRPCGGMISYIGEWHEEILVLMRNQLGRVVMTNICGAMYMLDKWLCVHIILCT